MKSKMKGLAVALLVIPCVLASAEEPQATGLSLRLEVELYRSYQWLFYPEDERGVSTLIRVPASDVAACEVGDKVQLSFEATGGELVYRTAAVAGVCDPDLAAVEGSFLRFDQEHKAGLFHVKVIPYEAQLQLNQEWAPWEHNTTGLVTVRVRWSPGRAVQFEEADHYKTLDRPSVGVK